MGPIWSSTLNTVNGGCRRNKTSSCFGTHRAWFCTSCWHRKHRRELATCGWPRGAPASDNDKPLPLPFTATDAQTWGSMVQNLCFCFPPPWLLEHSLHQDWRTHTLQAPLMVHQFWVACWGAQLIHRLQ